MPSKKLTSTFKIVVAFVVAIVMMAAVQGQTIYYVRTTGNDLNPGISWNTSFRTLQRALLVAGNNSQIWVAAGTYYPDEGGLQVNDSRSARFAMKNNVAIYGGFNGTETTLNQRPAVNPVTGVASASILSGDLAGNDGANFANNGENSTNVIFNNNVNNTAVLDGFVISGGNANSQSFDGGAIFNNASSPTITNCLFQNNRASNNGGALFNSASSGSSSSPTITNCKFQFNAGSFGGAMYNNGMGGTSSPTLLNCLFQNNFANFGGALYNLGSNNNGTSIPVIINCSFQGNSAVQGGALFNLGKSSPLLTNCSFQSNSTSDSGSVMYNFNGGRILNTNLTNCVLYNNGANNAIINVNAAMVSASFCLFEYGVTGYTDNGSNITGVIRSPFASNTSTQLSPASRAINTGSNAAYSNANGPATDLAGNPRFFNNSPVDMGAYEFQGAKQSPLPELPPTTTNNALNFDGVNDHVRILADTAIGGGNAITIEYWFKGTNIQSAVRFQVESDFISAGWDGSGTGTFKHILSNDGGANGINVGATATDGNWHHVAMTWQQNTDNGFKSYLDGQLVDQRRSSNSPLPSFTAGMYLGSFGGAAEFMNGSMDEVRIWNVARTQAQIQSAICGVTLPQPGLVAYYKFDHGTANGNNAGIETMPNSVNADKFPAVLNNFGLNGNTSNWVSTVPTAAITGITAGKNPIVGTETTSLTANGVTGTLTWYTGPNGTGTNLGSSNPLTNRGAGTYYARVIGGCGDPVEKSITITVQGSDCAPVLYVTPTGAGSRDGSSWTNAFAGTALQEAIDAAASCGGSRQVWVAKGTYKPTTGTNRNARFAMKNNVAIYGGFNGTETTLNQRPAVNPVTGSASASIISGDLAGNDGANFANNGENSTNVIFNTNVNNTAVLDGFVISGGNADAASSNGGAINNIASSPSITNCLFQNNNSSNNGGALFNGALSGSVSSPTITNCMFQFNAGSFGGAMYNSAVGGTSSPTLLNCLFQNNFASSGGALYNVGSDNGTSMPVIINCSFQGNSASFSGGAIRNLAAGGNSSPLLTNCSFQSNMATSRGGVMFNSNSGGSINAMLTNCVLYDNGANNAIINVNAMVSASFCLFEDGVTGFTDNGNNITGESTSPFASNTSTQLSPASKAINAGSNSAYSNANGPATDLAGNPRFFNSSPVDMGAYEFQGAKQSPLFVFAPITTNNALNFDGINDHVKLFPNEPIGGGNAITIEYWFKGTNIQSAVRFQQQPAFIVAGWNGGNTGTFKHILSNDRGTDGINVGATATNGEWHHVAMTWQQNTVNGFRSYVDGQLVDQRSSSNVPLPSFTDGMTLGSFIGISEFMRGSIDEVRVWNVARTQTQIQAAICSITLPQPGLVIYYKFDHGFANGNNAGTETMPNSVNTNTYAAVLNNFGLDGNTSNWVSTVPTAAITGITAGKNPLVGTETTSLTANGVIGNLTWFTGPNGTGTNLGSSNPLTNRGAGTYYARVISGCGDPVEKSITITVERSDCAPVLYVTPTGAGSRDGSSWTNAFAGTALQAAIDTAASCGGSRQVWVAKGTYKPTTGTNRNARFAMKNNVAIYGGFNGTETTINQRPPVNPNTGSASASILSGDLAGNDGANFANNGENSTNVIFNTNVNNTAVLDGFVISGGNANEGTLGGGAIYNAASSPSITNCLFQNNRASSGGALFNLALSGSSSSPTINNCKFQFNTGVRGGAMYNNGMGGTSSPTLLNCLFQNNFATNGGALYNFGSENGTSKPLIVNCSFQGNSASVDGGAIRNLAERGNSSPILINCSFQSNSTPGLGGVMLNFNDGGIINPMLTNCVLYDNGANNAITNVNAAMVSASFCLFEFGVTGYTDNGSNITRVIRSPFASNTSTQLSPASRAINTGSNAAYSNANGPATDLAGNPRFFNNSPVDMGTYEFQGAKQSPLPELPPTTTNNALNFDGVNDHVRILADTVIGGGNAITIEYWFKGTNIQSAVRFQAEPNFISAGWDGNNTSTFKHILSNDGGANGINVGAIATDGNWHHVAMTWQQNTDNGFKSYLDGQLVDQRRSSNSPLPSFTAGMYLGSFGGAAEFMNGSMDEVRIWNVARTQAQIQSAICSITLPQPGLVAYYKFDHGTANGNNAGIETMPNSVNADKFPAVLNNFALNNSTSNWVLPPDAISGITAGKNPLCGNETTTLTANGVTGNLTWYTGPNGTGTNLGSSNPLTNRGAGTYYARVTGGCGSPAERSITITLETSFTWTGAIDNVWSKPGNWSCNSAPMPISDIIINSGTPQLDIDFTVKGSIVLSGSGTLTINPNKILSISGTANFNNRPVTVQSTPEGTGSIGQVTGTLTGATNVTVEKYLPAYRAYRLLASSVTSAGNIRGNWQEGANNPNSSTNIDPVPGYGMHITGSTSGANGFDATQSGNPTVFTYNNGINDYTALANTNLLTLDAKTGYLALVRGNRTQFANLTTNTATNPTTLRVTGNLLIGNIAYNLKPADQFTMLTNPYASAINWAAIRADAANAGRLKSSYTYVDPRIGSRGGYVTVTGGIPTPSAGINANNDIQSGQAFFVNTSSLAPANAVLTIKENHKTGNNRNQVFRTGSDEHISIDLYFTNNGTRTLADGVKAMYGNYSKALNEEDVEEVPNFDENIAIQRNAKMLVVETRPLVEENDTIYLSIIRMRPQPYELQFTPSLFDEPNLMAFLQDSYLNTETQVNLDQPTTIPFSVNGDAASSAASRFRLVFKNRVVLPVYFTQVKAYENGSNIQVDWNMGSEDNVQQYEVEKSTDGRSFNKLGIQKVRTISTTTQPYQWLDRQPNKGDNFYRINAIERNGTNRYSQVVNVKVGRGNGAITVYPNPVTGNLFNVQLVNQPKGKYTLQLYNNPGQEVYRKELNHIGGSATETIEVKQLLPLGTYQLKVSSESGTTVTKIIFK